MLGGETVSGDATSNSIILGALALLFGLLAMALVLVNRTLKRFADAKGIEVPNREKNSNMESFRSKPVFSVSYVNHILISQWLFCLWLLNASRC